MTAPVVPTPVPVFPGPNPDPSDKASYGSRGRARWTYESGVMVPGMNDLADDTYQNALAAASSADVAVSAVGATLWVAATSYATGATAISPTNMLAYRRLAPGGVNATDPAASALWVEAGSAKVAKIGDKMIGNLGVPSLNGGQLAGFRNLVINGKFEVAVGATSFAAAGGATVSNWFYWSAGASVVTVSRAAISTAFKEFPYWLKAEVTTADTSIGAGERAGHDHLIEGVEVSRLIGQTFTVSFCVLSPKAGVHCLTIKNYGTEKSFVKEYTVAAANTAQRVSVTVPGGLPSSFAWPTGEGVPGVELFFTMAAGSSYHSADGVWSDSEKLATANQVNCVDTIGNVFAITGVSLHLGDQMEPYEHRPRATELALVNRYYEEVPFFMLASALNGGKGSIGNMGFFKTTKARNPSLSAAQDGALNGGDSLTIPTFTVASGSESSTGGKNAFYQSTVGTFTPHAGTPRDGLMLKVTANAGLLV